MIRETIGVGASIEEAVNNACAELGVSVDDIDREIIDYPKAKTFGLFGGSPAKVRVYYDDGTPEPKPTPAPAKQREQGGQAGQRTPAPASIREQRAASPSRESREAAPAREKKEAAPSPAQPFTEKPKPKTSTNNRFEKPKAERPAAAASTYETKKDEKIKTEADETGYENATPTPEAEYGEKTKIAVKYLSDILIGMGIENAEISVFQSEDNAVITLSGDSLGGAIGRRGENLSALQYLVSLAANNSSDEYFRISINVGNYREQRERSLSTLAKKTAERALKLGKNVALEPLNPYERRVIHTIIHDMDGVSSWSVGEDKDRHVVIGPAGLNEGEDGVPAPKSEYYGNRGGNSYGGRGGRGGYGGGYRNDRGGNRDGGRDGGYRGGNRSGSRDGGRDGGYRGGNRDGGRDGGYRSDNRGGNRDGGYRGGRGGRDGYRNDNRGGYNKGSYNNSSSNPINTISQSAPKKDSFGSLYGKIEVKKDDEK